MSFFRTILLIVVLLISWVAMRGGLHVEAAPNTPAAQASP